MPTLEFAVGSAELSRLVFCGCRSYYPVYPPPSGALLDTSLAATYLDMPFTPQIMVIPSDLTPFAKMLPPLDIPLGPTTTSVANETVEEDREGKSTMVLLNPGRLAKGVAGGTWAHLCIAPAAPLSKDTPALDSKGCDIHSRCRVDIFRI